MALQPRATTAPKPFSFAPSQAFEGNDGSWSTFVIRVGTPEQVFHVLISTAGQETWVPVPEGCLFTDPSNCGALRGVEPYLSQPSDGFQVNASTTWVPINLYELGLETQLNYTGNGEYGFDTVGLQLPNSGGVSLQHQIVAGIATKSFLFGVFAIGPKPTNFTSFNNPQPSFLYSLRNQSIIPSLLWGYTAGASYQMKGLPGSLTLGGYDASRFTPNNLTFSFSADDSRPLTVGLQTIQATNTFRGIMSLLPFGVLTFIDSTVPEIWLPGPACELFEAAFGLQFDESTQRYLVNETVHANLTTMNPVLTFKLGNDIESSETLVIDLPYKAFDLQASWPIYNTSTYYFPLRRADNESQYTLGRTFLQESYVVADYERGNFSVSQAVFQENNPQNIVAIYPPFTKTNKAGLSKSTMITIIVVIIVVAMLFGSISYILFRKWKSRKARAAAEQKAIEQREGVLSELGQDVFEVPGAKNEIFEAPSPKQTTGYEARTEMQGTDIRHELPTTERLVELPAVAWRRDRGE